ncbi:hypothetical protein [Selenomonas ruminantium]|uniref:Uncharacterized protein n=1 Tax=Selenomonas ruminantium TaxID=971 RepID=A0A1I0WU22_SELRU|nr:hypothetical protein [Selenomonas ruminantium]SFA91678.1 hypothetical protein SAMN05216587_103278 [Selenomonas ruminantium]
MTKTEVRTNWPAALESAKDVSMLSGAIGFGFTKDDLRELLALHKADKYRDKIEALLVECNFISFCCCLINKEYAKAIEMEELNEAD